MLIGAPGGGRWAARPWAHDRGTGKHDRGGVLVRPWGFGHVRLPALLGLLPRAGLGQSVMASNQIIAGTVIKHRGSRDHELPLPAGSSGHHTELKQSPPTVRAHALCRCWRGPSPSSGPILFSAKALRPTWGYILVIRAHLHDIYRTRWGPPASRPPAKEAGGRAGNRGHQRDRGSGIEAFVSTPGPDLRPSRAFLPLVVDRGARLPDPDDRRPRGFHRGWRRWIFGRLAPCRRVPSPRLVFSGFRRRTRCSRCCRSWGVRGVAPPARSWASVPYVVGRSSSVAGLSVRFRVRGSGQAAGQPVRAGLRGS